MTSTTASSTPDPLTIFGQLVREVDAARTLVVLTLDGDARRRAALDGLALARDLLADAAGLFTDPLADPADPNRSTAGDQALELVQSAGLTLAPWQERVLRHHLAARDLEPAATQASHQ